MRSNVFGLEAVLALQQIFEACDRIALAPVGELVVGAIARQIRAHRMIAIAVGHGLDQRRSIAFARAGDGLLHRCIDGQHVVAVDRDAGHRIRRRALGHAIDRGRVLDRSGQAVLIVLAQIDHRQLPQRTDVQALVEDAFVGRAVAEESDADRAVAAHLVGQRRAGADADAGADDAVRAEDVEVEVGDVHRAAEAFAIAGDAPHQLGHHLGERGALGDAVAVAAMMAHDEIVLAERGAGARGHRLLPDVAVGRPLHQAFLEQVDHALVEAADAQHGPVQGFQFLGLHLGLLPWCAAGRLQSTLVPRGALRPHSYNNRGAPRALKPTVALATSRRRSCENSASTRTTVKDPQVTQPIRVLLAKVGLDGHDRGVKVVARTLRDAGMDVIYTGLHRTPEEVVHAAIQEDVDILGISLLSGAHMTICPRILNLLNDKGANDIITVVGGVIPDEDVIALKKLGVSEILLQDTPPKQIVETLTQLVAQRGPR